LKQLGSIAINLVAVFVGWLFLFGTWSPQTSLGFCPVSVGSGEGSYCAGIGSFLPGEVQFLAIIIGFIVSVVYSVQKIKKDSSTDSPST
jgi:hypothetical protein